MLPDRRLEGFVALIALIAAASLLARVPVASADEKEDLSRYTGILLDARHLPRIERSPAPAVYGPAPDHPLLYPDRSHVPTPDEVQEQSIVRYYRTEEEARKGVGGQNPLILKADAVLSPAHDALRLSAGDRARFEDLDRNLHFTRTWRVGFLVPANR